MTKLLGPIAAFALMAAGAFAHAQTAQQTPDTQRAQRPPLTAQQVRPQVTQVQPPLVRATPPAQPPAQPSGAVTVAANAGWVPTGVKAQAGGQLVVLVRDGRWSVVGKAAGVAANIGAAVFGADGIPNSAGPGTLLPSANRGALIGRIGDGAPFLIGQRYSGVASADGELSVSINDTPNGFRDNQGALSIAVRATAPPPPTRTPDKPPARDPIPQPPQSTTPPTRTPPQQTPPPATRTPDKPTTRDPNTPPATTPPVEPPRPQDTKPPTPEPTSEPAPPVEDTAPLPTEQDAPLPEPPPPAVEQAPEMPAAVAPPTPPAAPAIPVVPIAIGAAILAGLLLLGGLFRPRRKSGHDDNRNAAAVPKVAARVVNDGKTGQILTITRKAERRS